MVHIKKRLDVEAEFNAAQAGTLGDVDEVTQRIFLEILLDIRHLVHRIYEKGFLHYKDGDSAYGKETYQSDSVDRDEKIKKEKEKKI